MALKDQKGITLIELIVFIVVIAVAIPAIVGPVLSLLRKSTKPEKAVTANFLGQQILEVITANDFPTLTGATPSGTTPAPDIPPGAVEADINSTINSSWPANYSKSWSIYYITGNDLVTQQSSATNYVRIDITVTDPDGTDYNYYSIVTKRKKDAPVE